MKAPPQLTNPRDTDSYYPYGDGAQAHNMYVFCDLREGTVPPLKIDLEVQVGQLAIWSARGRHHNDEWPMLADILLGVLLVVV